MLDLSRLKVLWAQRGLSSFKINENWWPNALAKTTKCSKWIAGPLVVTFTAEVERKVEKPRKSRHLHSARKQAKKGLLDSRNGR
ncbi:unnamed protein product [Gongylonema pulchrum]|uniref:Ovule protein n=1 Tax=Gongylonema pulchrum TaxID=637853 RepID=A0A183EUY7_9BILA|nr:unnamed protein product [Gongylonema pulchrum]